MKTGTPNVSFGVERR